MTTLEIHSAKTENGAVKFYRARMFKPGDTVSWVELAKPFGKAGKQRVGFVKHVSERGNICQVEDEHGNDHTVFVEADGNTDGLHHIGPQALGADFKPFCKGSTNGNLHRFKSGIGGHCELCGWGHK